MEGSVSRKVAIYLIVVFTLVLLGIFVLFPVTVHAEESTAKKNDIEQIKHWINEIAEQENSGYGSVTLEVNDIFFADESWAGYLVDFVGNKSESGYVITFKLDGELALIEIVFGERSPYYGKQGKFIYPSLGIYIIKTEDSYYNATTMEEIEYNVEQGEKFYASMGDVAAKEEPYTSSKDYTFGMLTQGGIEDFYYEYSSSILTANNHCATVAGLIMLNYWNKVLSNDLLKLSSEEMDSDNNISKIDSATGHNPAREYMSIFYDYMNTNWLGGLGGTLPSNAYAGFKRLIEEKGFDVEINTGLNIYEIQDSLENGNPVFITSTDYCFSEIMVPQPLPQVNSHLTGEIYHFEMDYTRRSGIANSHTFVAYGYAIYTFLDEGYQRSYDRLLKVATGWGTARYYNVSASDMYSVASVRVY